MNKYVNPNFFCKSINKLITCDWIETSKAEIGSSHTKNSGSIASALAIPIR